MIAILRNIQKHPMWQLNGLTFRSTSFDVHSTSSDKKIKENNEEKSAKPFSAVPKTFQVPILGTVAFLGKEFNEDYLKYFRKCNEKYGDIIRYDFIGHDTTVALFNPDDVMKVYRNEGKIPYSPGFDSFQYYRKKIRPDLFPISGGLIGEQGENWRSLRSKVQQDMLRPQSAVFFIKSLENIAEDLVEALRNNLNKNDELKEINTESLFYMWGYETICMIFLNKKMGCFRKHAFEEQMASLSIETINAAQKFLELANNLNIKIPVWKYFPKWVPWFQEFDKNVDILNRNNNLQIKNSINEIRKERKAHGDIAYKDKCILEKLIDKTKGEDYTIPILMAMDGITVGIDTTSRTAMILLYHLASNPAKQEILYDEIKKVIGTAKNITEKHLSLLPYLKACFQESQRLYPTASGTLRKLSTSLVLSGYKVPAGTVCYNAFQIISNKESNFKRANEYIPERWLKRMRDQNYAKINQNDNDEVPIHHPFSSLPFGHGPRMCIGRRFAILNIYMLTIKFIQSFKLEYHHDPIGLKTDFYAF